jgi:hypothetical protein
METGSIQRPPLAVGRTAEIYPWGEKQVVKLFRPGMPPGMAEKEAATGVSWRKPGSVRRPWVTW